MALLKDEREESTFLSPWEREGGDSSCEGVIFARVRGVLHPARCQISWGQKELHRVTFLGADFSESASEKDEVAYRRFPSGTNIELFSLYVGEKNWGSSSANIWMGDFGDQWVLQGGLFGPSR